MDDDAQNSGSWLQHRRQALRLTRDQLGRLASCSGDMIKKIETGLRRPSLDVARLLAVALEIPPQDHAIFVRFARGARTAAPVLPVLEPELGAGSLLYAPAQEQFEPSLNASLPRTGGARMHNLPVLRDALIGRDREVAEIIALLHRPEVALVTLTGPGGVGKTRLSQTIAMKLLEEFTDLKGTRVPGGVWFVDLAPITDPDLVLSTIAQVLEIKEIAGQSLLSTLQTWLEAKELLLVLDNCEQVLTATPAVANLLQGAPGLRVLATSREPLRLRGEYEVLVPPLTLPTPQQVLQVESLIQCAAVALFVQRVQAVKRDFQVTAENARAVAEICARLDGLPLAIELAAARSRVFSLQALMACLTQRAPGRLQFLTGGARDLPARQQTIRETIAWSYDLLDGTQQRLFRRLAVFGGSWMLEAAEAVCNAAGDLNVDVLNGLTTLVEQSLVRRAEGVDGALRFQWLETIREYALERLELDPEAAVVRQAYAAYYLSLAEHAEPELQGPEQRRWLDLLECEHDNLRATLGWCLDRGEVAWGLRLAAALTEFWWPRDHMTEGRQWLAALLRKGVASAAVLRANALYQAGQLAYGYGDMTEAEVLLEQSLTLYRELEDRSGSARVLRILADVATMQHDNRAGALRQEALLLFRQLDDSWGIAWMLYHIGQHEPDAAQRICLYRESIALARSCGYQRPLVNALNCLAGEMHIRGDLSEATRIYMESLALSRELDDRWTMAWAQGAVGALARDRGELPEAITHYEESLALHRRSGNQTGTAVMLAHLGDVLRWQGQYARAKEQYEESLRLFQQMKASNCCALVLCGLARVALLEGNAAEAQARFRASLRQCRLGQDDAMTAAILSATAGAVLYGPQIGTHDELFAARLVGAIGDRPHSPMVAPRDRAEDEQNEVEIQRRMGNLAWAQALDQGRTITLEQAVAYVLEEPDVWLDTVITPA